MNEHLERNLIADKKTKPLCRCLALSASLPLQQHLPPWTVINDMPDVSIIVNPVPKKALKVQAEARHYSFLFTGTLIIYIGLKTLYPQ